MKPLRSLSLSLILLTYACGIFSNPTPEVIVAIVTSVVEVTREVLITRTPEPTLSSASEPVTTVRPSTENDETTVGSEMAERLDLARRKVVMVGMRNGTGFFIKSDGTLITNEHVVRGIGEGEIPDQVMVTTFDGIEHEARVIGVDSSYNDIAVLKIDSDYPHFEFGQSSEMKEGDMVFAIGHPSIIGLWIVTKGNIHSFEMRDPENPRDQSEYATDISRPGNSGSPMLDTELNVIGVINGSTWDSEQTESPQEIQIIENIRDFDPILFTTATPSDLVSIIMEEILASDG